MGALTLRSVGAGASGTGTLTPGMPAGWQAGDLLALLTGCVSTSETLTAATIGAGWVEAASPSVGGLKLFLKVAQGGDTAPSFNWSGTSAGWAQLAAFDGDVYTDLSTIVADVITKASVTTRPKIWGLTVTVDNCLIITASRIVKTAVSNGTTYSSPVGSITELGEFEASGTSIAIVWGYQMQATKANVAEASWTPQGTAESSNVSFLAFTVALKTSSATATAQGAGGTSTAAASSGQAQGSSGVTAQGSGAVAAAVVAAATVSTDTQQIIVASGAPASTAVSLQTLFDPPAVDGDVYIVDKVTTPGGYAVTVNADGTFRFDGQGDESRQVIGVDLIQASNGRRRGVGYVAVNDLPPQLVGSAGGFISAPFAPFVPIDLRLHEQVRDPQGGTLTFELRAGPLPPGLRLTRGGRLHGVPTNIGTYPVTWGVRGAYGALTIIDDIIDVAYGASGAGATANTSAAGATATVSVTASGAGVSDSVSASTGSASGGGAATFDYYISPTGTGTAAGGGTLADPWPITMLNNATARARYAGFSVGLLDGTYDVYALLTPLANDGYAFTVEGGTAPSPTRIAAVNRRLAIINCKSGSSYGGGNASGPSVFGLLEEHITIEGLVITGHGRRGICVGNATGIQEPFREGISIKDCEFSDFSAEDLTGGINLSQIELNDSLGTLIQGNYFHDYIGYGVGDADHLCAIEAWSARDCIFELNTIKNQVGGFMGKAQNEDTCSNIFRYNYINLGAASNYESVGIFGWNEGDSHQANVGRAPTKIYNNVIVAQYPLMLRNVYLDSRTTRIFHPVEIYNNTFVVVSGGNVGATVIVDSSASASFYNNIITRVSGSADLEGMLHMTALLTSLIDYDHFYQGSGTRNFITSPGYDGSSRVNHSGLAAFATAMGNNSNGTTVDQHGAGSGGDPLFTGSGADALAYQLQAGSPCEDAGRSDGTSSGSVCDQGAWGGVSPPSSIGAAA